jgi:TRAP transporter 4TM/12TM fusion protein
MGIIAKLVEFEEAIKRREFRGALRKFIGAVAIFASLFHLYTARFGVFETMQLRSIHLALLLPLTFLLYPAGKTSPTNRATALDILMALAAVITALYIGIWDYERIITRMIYVDPLTPWDWVFGVIIILLVLEATRRIIGVPMALVGVLSLVYAYLGPYLPSRIAHPGFPLTQVLEHLYLTSEGIFGIPLGASATFIFLFVLFGAFLEKSGAGRFFIDLACGLAGGVRGGPAQVAVVTSALEGTVSGSAVANTIGSGTFTIPLMKSLGYKAHFAAAVEASASTGGQIMPPVMGVAAFILAEFVGIPYISVCVAALIPAFLYFLAVGFMVDFEAAKLGLKGLPREMRPDLKKILREGLHLILPLFALIYFLVEGYTAFRAAFYAILVVVASSFMRKATRMSFGSIVSALELGALNAIMVAVACASAGIIIGVISLTGLGVKFVALVINFSQGVLFLALPLVMLASLLLGMGVPTTAAYIMVAALAVPALVELGVERLAAHLFAFYFACVSAITPPVAVAAYAGAGIARANPFLVGVTSVKLAIAAYIVPFMFVYGPALLFKGTAVEILTASVTAALGCYSLAAGVQGWLLGPASYFQRALLLVSALALIKPGYLTDALGVGLLFLVMVWQKASRRTAKRKGQ